MKNQKTSDNTQPLLPRENLELRQSDRIQKFQNKEEGITKDRVTPLIQNNIPNPETFPNNHRKIKIHNRLYEVFY